MELEKSRARSRGSKSRRMSGASVAPVTNDVRGLAFRWSVRVFDRLPAREKVCNRHLRPREAPMSSEARSSDRSHRPMACNGLRFVTHKEAEATARNLMRRRLSVRSTRAIDLRSRRSRRENPSLIGQLWLHLVSRAPERLPRPPATRRVDHEASSATSSHGAHPAIKQSSSSPVRAFHQSSSRNSTGNGTM